MAPDETVPEYPLDAPPAAVPLPPEPATVGPGPHSLPAAPPPQVARVTQDGKVEPPEKRFFSSQGTEKVMPKGVHVEPVPAPPPPVVIPDHEVRKGAPARAAGPAAPDAPPADRSAADLRRAAALAVPIEAAFPDAAKRDAAVERLRAAVPWVPPLAVREHAAPRPGAGAADADPDTVLWRPLIVLPTDGKTVLSFFPGRAAGGYELVVAGHTPDGRVGTVRRVVPAAPK